MGLRFTTIGLRLSERQFRKFTRAATGCQSATWANFRLAQYFGRRFGPWPMIAKRCMVRRIGMVRRSIVVLLVSGAVAFAQQGDLKQRTAPDIPSDSVQVAAGTHILLRMMNSVSTRQTQVGDRIYLETAYPVFDSGRLLIPQGSWVMGTVTSVTRPKRVKGAGELQVRFDSLTFPNGVSRSFHSGLGAASGTGNEKVDHEKSTVKSDRDKGDDVAHTVERTADGAALGTVLGAG